MATHVSPSVLSRGVSFNTKEPAYEGGSDRAELNGHSVARTGFCNEIFSFGLCHHPQHYLVGCGALVAAYWFGSSLLSLYTFRVTLTPLHSAWLGVGNSCVHRIHPIYNLELLPDGPKTSPARLPVPPRSVINTMNFVCFSPPCFYYIKYKINVSSNSLSRLPIVV